MVDKRRVCRCSNNAIVAPLEATMSSSERRGEENPHLRIYLSSNVK